MRLALVLAMAVAAGLILGPAGAAPPAGRAPTVSVKAENLDLPDFVKELGKASPVPLEVRPALADQKVTAALSDVPLADARAAVADLFTYCWAREKRGSGSVEVLYQDLRSRLQQEEGLRRYAAAIIREHQARLRAILDGSQAARRLADGRRRGGKALEMAESMNARYGRVGQVLRTLAPADWAALASGAVVDLDIFRLPGTAGEAGRALVPANWMDSAPEIRAAVWIAGTRDGDTELELWIYIPWGGGTGFGWGLGGKAKAAVQRALHEAVSPGVPSDRLGRQRTSGRPEAVVPEGFRWRTPRGQLRDALVQLAPDLRINVLSDCHTRPEVAFPAVAGKKETEAVDAVAQAFGHDWAVGSGGIYLLRSRRWTTDDPAQVPNRLLDRWRDAATPKGHLGPEELIEMAQLKDAQLGTLALEISELASKGRLDWPVIRFYAGLTEAERQAARGRELPLAALPEERLAPLRQSGPTLDVRFSYEYTDALAMRALTDAALLVTGSEEEGLSLRLRREGRRQMAYYWARIPVIPYPAVMAPQAPTAGPGKASAPAAPSP